MFGHVKTFKTINPLLPTYAKKTLKPTLEDLWDWAYNQQ
jgi:hypothetical protein